MKEILFQINRADMKVMGKNGLEFVRSSYSKPVITKKYVELANSLLICK